MSRPWRPWQSTSDGAPLTDDGARHLLRISPESRAGPSFLAAMDPGAHAQSEGLSFASFAGGQGSAFAVLAAEAAAKAAPTEQPTPAATSGFVPLDASLYAEGNETLCFGQLEPVGSEPASASAASTLSNSPKGASKRPREEAGDAPATHAAPPSLPPVAERDVPELAGAAALTGEEGEDTVAETRVRLYVWEGPRETGASKELSEEPAAAPPGAASGCTAGLLDGTADASSPTAKRPRHADAASANSVAARSEEGSARSELEGSRSVGFEAQNGQAAHPAGGTAVGSGALPDSGKLAAAGGSAGTAGAAAASAAAKPDAAEPAADAVAARTSGSALLGMRGTTSLPRAACTAEQGRWEWRGTGPLRLNLSRADDSARLVLRQEAERGGVGTRVLVNAAVTAELHWARQGDDTDKFLRTTLPVEGTTGPQLCLLRFRSAEDAERMMEHVGGAIAKAQERQRAQ